MGEIILKDIDETLIEAISAEAALSGRPISEIAHAAFLRGLLAFPSTRLAMADRIRAMTPAKLDDTSTAIIRSLRDGV